MATEPVPPVPGGLSRIPFTAEAEAQIKRLSFWLNLVGWLNVLAAALDVLNLLSTARNAGHVVNLVLHVAVGVWSLQAGKAFKNVATTDRADQAYLVEGFTKLRSIFLLQGVLILVGLAFLAAVLLLLLVHSVATR